MNFSYDIFLLIGDADLCLNQIGAYFEGLSSIWNGENTQVAKAISRLIVVEIWVGSHKGHTSGFQTRADFP